VGFTWFLLISQCYATPVFHLVELAMRKEDGRDLGFSNSKGVGEPVL